MPVPNCALKRKILKTQVKGGRVPIFFANKLLLTEREGRTGEYRPEVVAVRTERSEVRAKTTEGQYSPVRSRASEVSK